MNNSSDSVRFDWRRDRVCCGRITVRVSGQEKAALRVLVLAAGEVCERDELMEAVWGTRAAHMDALYLTQLVYRLRKALKPLGLGDRVVTMPRSGYRFETDGLCIDDDPDADGTARSAVRRSRCRRIMSTCWRSAGACVRWLRDARRARPDAPLRATRAAMPLPVVHAASSTVTHAGATVSLTGFERALLEALVEHADTTVERQQLIARIWGDQRDVDASRLTRLVSRLRRSLQPLGLAQCVIHVAGEGYRFRTGRVEAGSEDAVAHGADDIARARGGRDWVGHVAHDRALPPPHGRAPEPSRDSTRRAAQRHGAAAGLARSLRFAARCRLCAYAALTGAIVVTLVHVHRMPVAQQRMRLVAPLLCTPDYVHGVFVRDVTVSLAARRAESMQAAIDAAWHQIVDDLRVAGCRSVSPPPSGALP